MVTVTIASVVVADLPFLQRPIGDSSTPCWSVHALCLNCLNLGPVSTDLAWNGKLDLQHCRAHSCLEGRWNWLVHRLIVGILHVHETARWHRLQEQQQRLLECTSWLICCFPKTRIPNSITSDTQCRRLKGVPDNGEAKIDACYRSRTHHRPCSALYRFSYHRDLLSAIEYFLAKWARR